MIWRDPNPKQKKVQRDTGTAVWGDPSGQRGVSILAFHKLINKKNLQEIRRWKDADQVSDYSAPPCGTDWATLPLNTSTPLNTVNNSGNAPTGLTNVASDDANGNLNNITSTTVTTGWGEPANTTIDTGTSRWSVSTNNGNNANNGGNSWIPQQGDVKPNEDSLASETMVIFNIILQY